MGYVQLHGGDVHQVHRGHGEGGGVAVEGSVRTVLATMERLGIFSS